MTEKPKNCEIVLNCDCNARCVFCYQPDATLTKVADRMSFEKAAEALYKGRRDGCWVAYLIGGEITLRDDLPKIIRLARGMGYPYVQVMTNGLKLSDVSYARELVSSGANIFRISVHGHNAELHDRLVGVPGAFRKVLKAFENAGNLGAELAANYALNRHNYKYARQVLELLSGRFGIEDFNIIFPHYTGMMAKRSAALKVSVTEAVPFLRDGLEFLKESAAVIEDAVFINLCPCNIPEAAHLMGEWERPSGIAADEPLFYLEGGNEPIYDLKERLRVKNKTCAECGYDDRCLGFERWYADVFGTREFRPVSVPAAPFPLVSSHKRLFRAVSLGKKRGRAEK